MTKNYNVKHKSSNEIELHVLEGAIMIPDAVRLAETLIKDNNAKSCEIIMNGEFLVKVPKK